MKSSLPAGSLLGARLEIGWSWLAVLPVVGIALYGSLSPATETVTTRAVAAAAGSFLLLGSVVVHELGHAVMARRLGIRVERVAVFLLGGFSEMDLDSAGPRQEALVAMGGPVASTLLGGTMLLASQAIGHGAAEGILRIMAVVNLGVAGFNLLPAFPLDGGRLVRAALISGGMQGRPAERMAAWFGVAVGLAVVIAAIVVSLVGDAAALVMLPVGLIVAVLAAAVLRPGPVEATERI